MGELLRLTHDEDGLRLVSELVDGMLVVDIVEMEGVRRTGGGGL